MFGLVGWLVGSFVRSFVRSLVYLLRWELGGGGQVDSMNLVSKLKKELAFSTMFCPTGKRFFF